MAALCSAQAAIRVQLVTPDALRTRLERGIVTGKARESTVRALFEEVGCATEEQRVNRSAGNVICKLSGDSDSVIIVGAHFDFVDTIGSRLEPMELFPIVRFPRERFVLA